MFGDTPVGDGAKVPFEIHIFTIFPLLVDQYCQASILGRASRSSALRIVAHDLRDHATGVHRSVDDAPFGGGAGMVLAPHPVFAAVEAIEPPRPLFLMSASGKRFNHQCAVELAGKNASGGALGEVRGFTMICGRYEGVDERIATELVDGEISIGDFVLAGGELAALVVAEAVARLVPGVLGNDVSCENESYVDGLLEYPQYTRPRDFRGHLVPEVLLSGDHARVASWRQAASLWRTICRRPDLIENRGGLTKGEARLVLSHGYPLGAVESGKFDLSENQGGDTLPEGV